VGKFLLLELNGLKEAKIYSCLTPSSLLIQPLQLRFLMLAACSGFNCFMRAFISSKRKAKDIFPGSDLVS
jgi:hypothetical protein